MKKLAYKKVGLSDFTILFYLKEMCSLLSAVLNGIWFRAFESLTFHSSQFRAKRENSHGIEKMMSQHCAQDDFDEITVRLVPALLQWFHFQRRGRSGGRGRWESSGRRGRRGSWWGIRRWIGRRGWRWIRLKEYYFITVSLNFVFSVGSLEIDFDNGNGNGIAFI